ncbi:MAG: hypothetical protein ACTS8S_21150 [Giesbergeria sp.]
MNSTSKSVQAQGLEAVGLVKHNRRTYRVRPSEFGGWSVVEVLASGIARPVRNLKERDAVVAKATGATS